MQALTLAAQSLRDTIALYHTYLLSLLTRPNPPPSSSPEYDPVLQALGDREGLVPLLAAQRAADDAATAAAAAVQ